ncbi:polysaccharide pyruvyl transferase family protein [Bradyrhizobium sp. Cp5.3]|uniref:polysaccharide pyruvyl transferase family protein n=1 Tax=Bradyrhizobium sp. Cp5.3 TaxID=443598 RepID=UPI0004148F7F|nr:polysaccharide pyruvyl transferase family protein [Bradyrhizobium sp. Cp5.3]
MSLANRRIGLLHHVGGGNLGDEATLESVAENIKRRWPTAEIIAFSMNPDDTNTRHGIVSHPIRQTGWSVGYKPAETDATFKASVKALVRNCPPLFSLLKAGNAVARQTTGILRELHFLTSSYRHIKSLDLLIVSGGGQLTERDGPWGFPYTIFKWIVLARWAGVRCMFLNVGAGPLTGPLSKLFVRRALAAAQYVSLRDQKSRDLLDEIGFKRACPVYPDSAYGLQFALPSNVIPLERRSHPIVGFAPLPYPGPRVYAAEEDQIVYDVFIGKLAGFASWLLGQSCALTVFGTDIGVDPMAVKDFETVLANQLGINSTLYSVDRTASVHDLLATMARMDFVVTCRFHGVIFAHLLNKPVLAIAHHPKVSDLMADLGLSNYCVDIRNFDLNLLTDRFASMIANAEDIKSRMAVTTTRNRQRLTNQFDELFDADAAATMAREPSWSWRRRDQTGRLSCG